MKHLNYLIPLWSTLKCFYINIHTPVQLIKQPISDQLTNNNTHYKNRFIFCDSLTKIILSNYEIVCGILIT